MPDKFKDLKDQVTVFVLTTGEETTFDCLSALRRQSCDFKLEQIVNVSPMSAALQQMLDRCKTPYLVQVDADMILEPNAIARLHRAIEQEPDDVMQLVISLRDEHLEMDILGVRIMRHEIAKQFPLEDVQGCEVHQLRRAEKAGFRTVAKIGGSISPVGRHELNRTTRAVYERYRVLFRRSRMERGFDWVGAKAKLFLKRFMEEPTQQDLFAILGAVVGLTCSLDVQEGEKDTSKVPEELIHLHDVFGGIVRDA